MYFRDIFTALLGLSSLAAAVPTKVERDVAPALEERNIQKRTIIVNQFVQETSLIVVNQNLDVIDDLTRLAETQFAALIQSQLALATQLQVIKNNIRVNHFRSRFAQVNTVIVTVNCVVDLRDEANVQNRYLVNQLLADNGFPEKQLVVMVSDIETMTIHPTATASVEGLFGVGASLASFPTGAPIFQEFNPEAPYGAFNESLLLPIGAVAPTLDLVFQDPASIIYPQQILFIESAQTFLSSCNFYIGHASAFVDLTSTFFTTAAQIAAAQLRGLGGFGTFFPPTATAPANATFTAEVIEETATATEAAAEEDMAEENADAEKEDSKKKEKKKMEK